MMNMNIDKKFGEYIREQEGFHTRLDRLYEEFESGQMREGRIIEWMHAAYRQGARDMAQDTVDTLGDYACAVAGLPEVVYTYEAAFDSAKANLMTYYTQVLDESKD
jgi:hypothetical protein